MKYFTVVVTCCTSCPNLVSERDEEYCTYVYDEVEGARLAQENSMELTTCPKLAEG